MDILFGIGLVHTGVPITMYVIVMHRCVFDSHVHSSFVSAVFFWCCALLIVWE